MNLFGEEFEAPEENACAQDCSETEGPKKGKKKKSEPPKQGDAVPLEVRAFRVKIYNDFYDYVVPEEVEAPTMGHLRQWLVGLGYSELTKDRATFTWIKPEEGDKFVVAGVKFEKQG